MVKSTWAVFSLMVFWLMVNPPLPFSILEDVCSHLPWVLSINCWCFKVWVTRCSAPSGTEVKYPAQQVLSCLFLPSPRCPPDPDSDSQQINPESPPHPNKGPLSVVCWKLYSMRNRATGSPVPSESIYGSFPMRHCSCCRSFCALICLVLVQLTCSSYLSWLTFCCLYSFQFLENSCSHDSLLPPTPSPQWDGLPWSFSTSFFKELAVLFKILFLFKTPSVKTLSSLYWDTYIFFLITLALFFLPPVRFIPITWIPGCMSRSSASREREGILSTHIILWFCLGTLGSNLDMRFCRYFIMIPSPSPGSVSVLKKICTFFWINLPDM